MELDDLARYDALLTDEVGNLRRNGLYNYDNLQDGSIGPDGLNNDVLSVGNGLNAQKNANQTVFLVVDTNYLLSDLKLIHQLILMVPNFNACIFIPYIVIKELDGLKSSKKMLELKNYEDKAVSIGVLARNAINLLQELFLNHSPGLVGQRKSDTLDSVLSPNNSFNNLKSFVRHTNSSPDDLILDCCLFAQAASKNGIVFLLSNDKNLCLKALIHHIEPISQFHQGADILLNKIINYINVDRNHPNALNNFNPNSNSNFNSNNEQATFQQLDEDSKSTSISKDNTNNQNSKVSAIDLIPFIADNNIPPLHVDEFSDTSNAFKSFNKIDLDINNIDELEINIINTYTYIMNILIQSIFNKYATKLKAKLLDNSELDFDKIGYQQELDSLNKYYNKQLTIDETFKVLLKFWYIFKVYTSSHLSKDVPKQLKKYSDILRDHQNYLSNMNLSTKKLLNRDFLIDFLNSTKNPISDMLLASGAKLEYIYDFSSWINTCKDLIKKFLQK